MSFPSPLYDLEDAVKIVNLTPHAITLRSWLPASPSVSPVHGKGKHVDQVIEPSGRSARVVTEKSETTARISGVNAVIVPYPDRFPRVEGGPDEEEQEGVMYIVSAKVLAQCEGQDDVFAPGTGPDDEPIRDDKGRIIAVTRLIAAPKAEVFKGCV